MSNIYIINTINDAKDYVSSYVKNSNILYCTHAAIETFLWERHELKCECISNLITSEELFLLKQRCLIESKKILTELDNKNTNSIEQIFNLKEMRIFTPVFSYLGFHKLLSYRAIEYSMVSILQRYKDSTIYFYDKKLNDLFDSNIKVEQFVDSFNSKYGTSVQVICSRFNGKANQKINIFVTKIKRIILKPKILFEFISNKIIIGLNLFLNNILNRKHATILLYGELFDLAFLLTTRAMKHKILYIGQHEDFNRRDSHRSCNNILFESCDTVDDFHKLILQEYVEFIEKKHQELFLMCEEFELLLKNNNIKLAVWGNPPIHFKKALLFEYLRHKNIKILGAQHGSAYMEQYCPEHFESDFNNCNYYISYGFDGEDLSRCYPSENIFPSIFPLGRIDKKENKSFKGHKSSIDILFPITNSASAFAGGFSRMPFGYLCNAQKKIINFLQSLVDHQIYIKPMIGANENNSCIGSWSHSFNTIKYIDDISLSEFLEQYIPRICILEFPSTPLQDLIVLNAEIFLLLDPIIPYENIAFLDLQKRVHCYYDVDSLLTGVSNYLAGNLESKHDNAFLNHYVSKPSTKENILKTIDSIIKEKV